MDRSDFPQIPGYKILKKLGQGGMATVYLASQESIGREIALKIMAPHLSEDNLWAKRFIKEAQVIAQLTHPNIVPVYDVGTHEGHFYIAMEYLKNGSLENKKHGELSLPETLKIVAGVAAGLDYAGEKGFVHRDIKPDNIMFREDGSPVILDFGIVKQKGDADSKMTQTGVVVGTATYMSPEQAQDQALDERSDIYSLGIMLYVLLVGNPPFRGTSTVATMLMHISEPPPPLPKEFTALQPVLDKALAKSRDDRYKRAREMVQHIKNLEQEIKKIIATQHIKIMQGSDDDTMEMDTLYGDKTEQIECTTSREHTIADEELTKVLSSAQATIKDFSEESRMKKAKRGRRFLIGLIVATLGAFGFVAYQQLYLAPQERALAEETIRIEKEKTKRKIDELLMSANTKSIGVRPENFKSIDDVIILYREVLVLDPDNTQAKSALESFGNMYLDSAQSALASENTRTTERFLSYAQQLAPANPRIETLRREFAKSRALILDKKYEQDKVQTLIDLAKKEIDISESFSDNAYLRLQQVLRLDENNEQATAVLRSMLNKTEGKISRDLSEGKLSTANLGIQSLERYDPQNTHLATFKREYQKLKSKSQHDQNMQALFTRAKKLERESLTRRVNIELKDTWLEIMSLDANHTRAKQGLADTNAFSKKLALTALEARDVDQAERDLQVIKHGTPQSVIVMELSKLIADKRQSITQATTLIRASEKLLGADQRGEKRRTALAQARTQIDKAHELDAKNPALKDALEKLESAYVLSITESIRDNDRELVKNLFSDVEGRVWPTNRLLDLQLSQRQASKNKENKKPKRVIGGGF